MTVLYINHYIDKNFFRNSEMADALLANLDNPEIDQIVAFVDVGLKFEVQSPKLYVIGCMNARPTFSDYFIHINLNQNSYLQLSIIANSDIEITPDAIRLAKKNLQENQVYALSRYDHDEHGNLKLFERRDSQDTWMFNGPIKKVEKCNFSLGIPGCDNAIADRLKKAGYQVLNPSKSLVTIHHHKSEIRNYDKSVRIGPPYYFVWPHEVHNTRLLHVGIFDKNEPQQALRTALRKFSAYYEENDWRALVPARNPSAPGVNNYLAQKLDTGFFNTVFLQIQAAGVIAPSVLQKYSERGIKFYNFNGDVRIPFPQWHKEVAPYVTTLLTNEDNVQELQSGGFLAQHFQIGFDENIYKPQGGKLFLHPEIVYIGNNHRGFPLSSLRVNMISKLRSKYPEQFVCYGLGWEPKAKDLNYKQETEAAAYRSSKMAINLSHVDFKRYTSDRMFRLMGCGTLCLAYNHKGLWEDFIDGIHLRTWKNIGELEALIDYYLNPAHEEERQLIATNGMNRVREFFTWEHRINYQFRNIITGSNQHNELD